MNGASYLTVKVPGTGSWDTYRRQQVGEIELRAGKQSVLRKPEGKLDGALIDGRRVLDELAEQDLVVREWRHPYRVGHRLTGRQAEPPAALQVPQRERRRVGRHRRRQFHGRSSESAQPPRQHRLQDHPHQQQAQAAKTAADVALAAKTAAAKVAADAVPPAKAEADKQTAEKAALDLASAPKLKAAQEALCLQEGRVALAGQSATLSHDAIAAAYFGT